MCGLAFGLSSGGSRVCLKPAGNELVQQIEIDMPGIARGGLRADLEELRNLHHLINFV